MGKKYQIEFVSSNGTLIVGKKGKVKVKKSDLSGWLLEIGKVDIKELKNYYKLNGLKFSEFGDVVDFGYWDKNGVYHAADKPWRLELFHNKDYTEKQIKKAVKKSFQWIAKNRAIKKTL